MSSSQPQDTDAILGGQTPPPLNAFVLGGIEGIRTSLRNRDKASQILALTEALKFDRTGLELLIDVWKNDLHNLKWEAFSLLRDREEENVKQALQEYNPWLDLSCVRTWQRNSAIKYVTIAKDGNTLFSGDGLGINVWNIQTKEQSPIFMAHTNTSSLAITSNGVKLVSRGGYYDEDNGMVIWNTRLGEWDTCLPEYGYMVSSLVISPCDRYIICGGSDNNCINVWELETENKVKIFGKSQYLIQALTISNDGRLIISGANDRKVKVWNLETEELLTTFKNHSDGIESVAISPDNQTVISGSKDKTVKVWSLQTKKLKFTLEGHTGLVYYVAISPDGNYIFSCGRDKTIRVWNLHTGECVDVLKGHTGWVYCLAVSSDGKTLISSSRDKTIKVWRRDRTLSPSPYPLSPSLTDKL